MQRTRAKGRESSQLPTPECQQRDPPSRALAGRLPHRYHVYGDAQTHMPCSWEQELMYRVAVFLFDILTSRRLGLSRITDHRPKRQGPRPPRAYRIPHIDVESAERGVSKSRRFSCCRPRCHVAIYRKNFCHHHNTRAVLNLVTAVHVFAVDRAYIAHAAPQEEGQHC
jgi:hypothetical protein